MPQKLDVLGRIGPQRLENRAFPTAKPISEEFEAKRIPS